MVKRAAADRKMAKEELARKQASDAAAAGALVTSGVFGTSTIEIYENGYVRVASWGEGESGTGPKNVDKNTRYEKLRSIKFTLSAEGQASGGSSSLEGSVGTAVMGLIKGGRALAKATPTGLAVSAATSYLASSASAKSFLTIATDRQIHTLTNQSPKTLGIKTSNKAQNDVGRALEAAGNAVLGFDAVVGQTVESDPQAAAAQPAVTSHPATEPTLSDRLHELASLHREGILSDEEFAAAKAKLLSGL